MYISKKGKCFHVYEGRRTNGKVQQVYICSLGRTDNPQQALEEALQKNDKARAALLRQVVEKTGRTGRTKPGRTPKPGRTGRTEKTALERELLVGGEKTGRTKPGRTGRTPKAEYLEPPGPEEPRPERNVLKRKFFPNTFPVKLSETEWLLPATGDVVERPKPRKHARRIIPNKPALRKATEAELARVRNRLQRA